MDASQSDTSTDDILAVGVCQAAVRIWPPTAVLSEHRYGLFAAYVVFPQKAAANGLRQTVSECSAVGVDDRNDDRGFRKARATALAHGTRRSVLFPAAALDSLRQHLDLENRPATHNIKRLHIRTGEGKVLRSS